MEVRAYFQANGNENILKLTIIFNQLLVSHPMRNGSIAKSFQLRHACFMPIFVHKLMFSNHILKWIGPG